MQVYRFVAKTFHGLEQVLADELKTIGASDIELQNRAVLFTGDKAMMYRANYHLRTAIAILKPIAEFYADDEEQLYKQIGKINWSSYMGLNETLAVTAVTFGNVFNHSKFVALKVKDAIVDQFRRTHGDRPNVDPHSPDIKIQIHIAHNKCSVLLDSSGDPLFKRGYRVQTNEAPINEVLAAGMIKLTGWQMDCNFYDPMCGSGTLLIEAAMMAYGIAPGTYRQSFGFEKWPDFDSELWIAITEESFDTPVFKHSISGSDISASTIETCKRNLKESFLAKKIEVTQKDFFDIKPSPEKGIIVTNPPYGERLQPNDLKIFYQKIGDKLKIDFAGYEAWLIGSDLEVLKFIGLKPSRKIQLFNGPLECSFRKYSVYQGSKFDNPKP